jgi:hypothetical protein
MIWYAGICFVKLTAEGNFHSPSIMRLQAESSLEDENIDSATLRIVLLFAGGRGDEDT